MTGNSKAKRFKLSSATRCSELSSADGDSYLNVISRERGSWTSPVMLTTDGWL